MKKPLRITTWIGIAAATLMIALVVMQFIPYWRYQGESASIAAYIWRPYKNTAFTSLFRSYFGKGFKVSLLFALPVAISLAASAVGAVLCAFRSSRATSYLAPTVSGIAGLYAFLAHPAYKLSNLWLPMLILLGLVLALGIAGMILARVNKRQTI